MRRAPMDPLQYVENAHGSAQAHIGNRWIPVDQHNFRLPGAERVRRRELGLPLCGVNFNARADSDDGAGGDGGGDGPDDGGGDDPEGGEEGGNDDNDDAPPPPPDHDDGPGDGGGPSSPAGGHGGSDDDDDHDEGGPRPDQGGEIEPVASGSGLGRSDAASVSKTVFLFVFHVYPENFMGPIG